MIPCNVQWHAGCALLVEFEDGRELLLQDQCEQASFAYSCGLCASEDEGYAGWENCDPTTIEQCPSDYWEVTRAPHPLAEGEPFLAPSGRCPFEYFHGEDGGGS